jgi:hypothetical protein
MQVIFDDASRLADAIRQGGSLPSIPAESNFSPIRCGASETLFEHANEKGETVYTTYHFTEDFKTLNAGAQYYLHVMYSRIYVANILADKLSKAKSGDGETAAPLSDDEITALKNAVDETLAMSAYYINYFRGYYLSVAIYLGHGSQKAIDEHAADWVRKMDQAKRAMFRPERLRELVPDRRPQFVLAISEPYRKGQKVINGVYFKPEHAEPLLASMAAAQAKAVSGR